MGVLRLVGTLAWHIWWIVHPVYLAGFQNRLIVFLQWAWSYFTHDRPALLITEREPEDTPDIFEIPSIESAVPNR